MTAYDTYINANTYFESRLYTLAWDEASSADKTVALAEATQRIDRLRFNGIKVAASQELEFPQYYGDDPDGTEVVPNDIKIACYEVAYALLDGVDPDLELESMSVASEGYSSVRMAKFGNVPQEHIAAGIPSATAWRHLKPYLASDSAIQIRRVS